MDERGGGTRKGVAKSPSLGKGDGRRNYWNGAKQTAIDLAKPKKQYLAFNTEGRPQGETKGRWESRVKTESAPSTEEKEASFF